LEPQELLIIILKSPVLLKSNDTSSMLKPPPQHVWDTYGEDPYYIIYEVETWIVYNYAFFTSIHQCSVFWWNDICFVQWL